MTAGPESECLRRATRYSARGIEAAWPRRCAARFTRARSGDSRTRKDEKQQQRELGKCGYLRGLNASLLDHIEKYRFTTSPLETKSS
jgi:hypothetical protein